jgi:hypothetical protein
MPRRARPHGPDKRGADGLSDREREFAHERRRDPIAPNWQIAHRAGFKGDAGKLGERARLLMKKAQVLAIVNGPADPDPLDGEDGELDGDKLLGYLKRQLLVIVRGYGEAKDKLSAIDKLISTVPGGYAPAGIDLKHRFGMEDIVRLMGGAPGADRALPAAAQTPTLEEMNGSERKAADA